MDLSGHGFLEEFLAIRRENWDAIPTEINEFFSSDFSFESFSENPPHTLPNSSFEGSYKPLEKNFNFSFNEVYCPLGNAFLAPQIPDSSPFLVQECLPNVNAIVHNSCKMEPFQSQSPEVPVFNIGSTSLERKNGVKKLEGQMSKNLMAERRRRKRVNDRLSMLRSIVPKISKMDRTSILADAIDYVKELLERVHNFQQEIEMGSNEMNIMSIFRNVKPNEILVRNSPKIEVERRNTDTRIEIFCAGKPGLLLSTVNTLETLGLDIQQCVISCFNDFEMQVSCSKELEQTTVLLSSEDIKQAIFRNAGYGGRCL